MSKPTPDLKTNRAIINCTNMPTITVCHLTAVRFLEVAYKKLMITSNPNKETARLARLLSSLSGLAKPPIKKTEMTVSAPSGSLKRSGNNLANRTPVLFHVQCIGFVIMVMGTWKNTIRNVTPSQKRKGLSHPLRFSRSVLLIWNEN